MFSLVRRTSLQCLQTRSWDSHLKGVGQSETLKDAAKHYLLPMENASSKGSRSICLPENLWKVYSCASTTTCNYRDCHSIRNQLDKVNIIPFPLTCISNKNLRDPFLLVNEHKQACTPIGNYKVHITWPLDSQRHVAWHFVHYFSWFPTGGLVSIVILYSIVERKQGQKGVFRGSTQTIKKGGSYIIKNQYKNCPSYSWAAYVPRRGPLTGSSGTEFLYKN